MLAVVVGVGMTSGDDGGGAAAGSTSTTQATTVVSTSPAVATVATAATSAPIVKVPLARTLGEGVTGDDVEMVQERLLALGFDLGEPDGIYGGLTIQAVWAFEKLVMGVPRGEAAGRVTPEMWDRMQGPIEVTPRRPTGGLANHVEVYLPEQVMVIFHADRPALIAHISSGELDANGQPAYYCDKATWDTDSSGNPYPEPRTGEACAYAKTPGGVFAIRRMVQGQRVSPLGGMMNPAYFNYGIAIHGADNVPLRPASHGCVRINQYLGAKFQSLLTIGDRVLVWGHDGQEPEDYSDKESLPSFDARTYDTTTTTSTTTTTTTSTTVAPAAPPPPANTTSTVAQATTTLAPATTTTTTTTTVAPG